MELRHSSTALISCFSGKVVYYFISVYMYFLFSSLTNLSVYLYMQIQHQVILVGVFYIVYKFAAAWTIPWIICDFIKKLLITADRYLDNSYGGAFVVIIYLFYEALVGHTYIMAHCCKIVFVLSCLLCIYFCVNSLLFYLV